MATGSDVMTYFYPNGGFYIQGDDFSTVFFSEGVIPITKEQFETGFEQYDSWKAEQDATKAAAKATLLARLGITEEEAQLLIGGSN
jgi:hypothetical protein